MTIQPTRTAQLPATPPVQALTATAKGMVQGTMVGAAEQAFGELMGAVRQAGLMDRIGSCVAWCPDRPQGSDDPHCRYVAGVVFGLDLAGMQGQPLQPTLPLAGTLAWHTVAPGRYAVFTHRGPYDQLTHTWQAIYRDWLPQAGVPLSDAAPMELSLNDPRSTAPEDLLTEIWIPLR